MNNGLLYWLVVSAPLKNMSSSVGIIPNIWKVIKFHGSKPPIRWGFPKIGIPCSSPLGNPLVKHDKKKLDCSLGPPYNWLIQFSPPWPRPLLPPSCWAPACAPPHRTSPGAAGDRQPLPDRKGAGEVKTWEWKSKDLTRYSTSDTHMCI